ncbi:MAG: hypothetical protein LBT23_05835 [Synergistaceae bacterium]|jgi:hypothetical protein|nr:hypothetical protein [Synergistaceae bacterium]
MSTTKPTRIMEILAHETGGKSYKSHKYRLDESERSSVEYGEVKPKRPFNGRSAAKQRT